MAAQPMISTCSLGGWRPFDQTAHVHSRQQPRCSLGELEVRPMPFRLPRGSHALQARGCGHRPEAPTEVEADVGFRLRPPPEVARPAIRIEK
jgi:hypothetical protein